MMPAPSDEQQLDNCVSFTHLPISRPASHNILIWSAIVYGRSQYMYGVHLAIRSPENEG